MWFDKPVFPLFVGHACMTTAYCAKIKLTVVTLYELANVYEIILLHLAMFKLF
jgi:hypothetical protein